MLSIREVKCPSLFNLIGLEMRCLKPKEDMLTKLLAKSELDYRLMLKSPTIEHLLFSLVMTCKICCVYSLKSSILILSGGR